MALGSAKKSKAENDRQEQLAEKSKEKISDLAKSKNWYIDRHQRIIVQRNFLFIITLVILFFMGISVYMVSELNRRKVFEPFVVQVEEKSGIITQVTNDNYEKFTADEMVIRYFINKYINARESYHPANYDYNFNQVVRVLSDEEIFEQFAASIKDSNPQSPLRLGVQRMRRVNISSLSFMDSSKKNVQVRFVTNDVPIGSLSARPDQRNYIVTLQYSFSNLPNLGAQGRMINPLGFQVTQYVKERESLNMNFR